MKRKLLLAACAFMGISAAWAQGTWDVPVAPGVNPLEASGDVYLYNIEADAFVNAGMNWGTKAIATRLEKGDSEADNRHAITIINVEGSDFQMKLNMLKNANNGDNAKVIFCGDGTVNDIWADNNTNPYWTASESEIYKNAYTLQNKKHSEYKLDVAWLYGGPLTVAEGQGFYDWAFIPAESINDGSYAKFKERRKMYAIYQELVNTGNVSKYSEALSTANAVYVNTDASKDALIAATRTLLIAVADGIENPVNANFLFDSADILGNNDATAWGGPANFKAINGVFEDWHGNCGVNPLNLTQSKTELPNGLYDVVFHGLYRQDGDVETAPHLTVTGSNVLEDDLNLIGTLAEQWKVDGGGNEKNGNMDQWTGTGGKQVPNHQWSANQGMALGDAVAKINNVQVKEGSLTIELAITGKSQWVLFQGFDIIYNGPINVALYKKLVSAQNEANGYVSEQMNAEVKSKLQSTVAESESLTSNSEEEELNDALEALNSAIKDALASIDVYKEIKTAISNFQILDQNFETEKYDSGEYVTVSDVYADYYAYKIENIEEGATDYTDVIINPGFELGDTFGWTYTPSSDHGAKSTSDGNYAMSGSEGNYLFNIWSKGNPITQTIVGLPEGYYQLKAVVAGADDNGAGKAYLIANDSHEGVRCNVNKAIGTEGSIIAKVEADGILTIGVVGANNDADLSYTEGGVWWYKVDNFRLTYLGEELPNVSVEISAAGYATFSSELPLDLSNLGDATAYIVADDAEDDYIKLTEQAKAVPANTGLIIAGKGTVTIPVVATGNALETNYLVAGTGAQAPVGSYVFSWKDADPETAGFYVVTETVQPTVEKGKAYLQLPAAEEGEAEPTAAKVLHFVFGDGTATSVEAVEVKETAEDGVLYNVAGQQVGKDYKGIVIKNGKKYLNK